MFYIKYLVVCKYLFFFFGICFEFRLELWKYEMKDIVMFFLEEVNWILGIRGVSI